ncbi:MAG: hypothetical protein QF780_10715 [Candidatus Marinimicrobia bacterium]|nr:hypothetical protein [Candidatus Neomarinimicrobiota bacterium]
MTPRLRMLSIGLALSLSWAIYDYVDRNSDEKPVVGKAKVKKRARTAGVSASRAENLERMARLRKEKFQKEYGIQTTPNNFTAQSGFLPISNEVKDLEGWARNPFVEVYEPKKMAKSKTVVTTIDEEAEMEEQSGLTTLDGLIIETAVRMGEKAFVTINGQTFKEGDIINDALIEKIENEQITFKVGKTRIIKDVGT